MNARVAAVVVVASLVGGCSQCCPRPVCCPPVAAAPRPRAPAPVAVRVAPLSPADKKLLEESPRVTAEWKAVPFQSAIVEVARQTKLNVVTPPGIGDRPVSLRAEALGVAEVLDELARQARVQWGVEPYGIVRITDRPPAPRTVFMDVTWIRFDPKEAAPLLGEKRAIARSGENVVDVKESATLSSTWSSSTAQPVMITRLAILDGQEGSLWEVEGPSDRVGAPDPSDPTWSGSVVHATPTIAADGEFRLALDAYASRDDGSERQHLRLRSDAGVRPGESLLLWNADSGTALLVSPRVIEPDARPAN